MSSSAGELGRIAADLGRSRERLETAFVGVGDSLTKSATLLNRITQSFETLPQDLASPELTEATARLSAVGRRAQEISTSFAAEQGDIARLVAVVTGAEHPISDLRRAVKMMGIVAVNARVVAASVIGNDNDVDVFTTDIAQLAGTAGKTISEFSAVYAQLTAEVHRAAEQREQFEAAHRDTLSGLAARLDANLADIVRRRDVSAGSSAETSRVSRQIAERVASVVMSMQVGDSTRQRLEHVETALATLAAQSGGEDQQAILADVAVLEIAQLSGTGETFDAEIAEAETALNALATDAKTVMTRSRKIYGEGSAGGQSSLSAFTAEIHAAVDVLRHCEAERSKLERVASAVQATVTILLQHVEAVREIEASMRLVSLNAAVRCAQLGPRGRALNVIAMQLRDLTGDTVTAAEAAMESLGNAAGLARSFGAASSGEAAGQVAWLEQEAATALSLLEKVDRRLGEALALLDHDAPAAVAHLTRAARELSGHAGTSEAISTAAARLVALAGHYEGLSPASRPLLDQLRRTYTMGAERTIHDRLVPKEALAA